MALHDSQGAVEENHYETSGPRVKSAGHLLCRDGNGFRGCRGPEGEPRRVQYDPRRCWVDLENDSAVTSFGAAAKVQECIT